MGQSQGAIRNGRLGLFTSCFSKGDILMGGGQAIQAAAKL
jgi:hypothetical protein